MKELHYENQGTNTYLVYAINPNDSVDSMSLGMLTNNRIHGLAQTIFTQIDNQKFIKFNVSAKVSVAQFFAGAVNKKRLLGVFTGIVNAMLAAEDYMLEPASIIMDLDYIFTDVSTCETDLICLPITDTEMQQPDLGMFFRNIMFNTQFDQTENCDHVAKIINYLNSTPAFSLTDFKKLLEEIEGQKVQPVVKKVNNDTPAITGGTQPKKQQVVIQAQPVQQPQTTLPPANTITAGMNIPPAQKAQYVMQREVTPEGTGPEISFFYLMQHYNKENAAAYKAQKEAKKCATAVSKGKTPVQQAPAQKTQSPIQPTNNFGFAVPGQAALQAQLAHPVAQPVVQKTTTPAQQPVSQIRPQPQPVAPVSAPVAKPLNFGETTVLGGSVGETTVLGGGAPQAAKPTPHLFRVKNNEKIPVNKPVFRIGKEKSYVDYFVSDNTAISRSHANIVSRDGEYFVVDTNSTNHTYVNGGMIQSNVETKLSHGTKIRLANEEFEFRLY